MRTLTRTAAIDREIRLLVDELLVASRHYRNAKKCYGARQEHFDTKHGTDTIESEIAMRDDDKGRKYGRRCAWYGADTARLGTALSALIAARGTTTGRRADDDERDWHLAPREADEGFAINRPGRSR